MRRLHFAFSSCYRSPSKLGLHGRTFAITSVIALVTILVITIVYLSASPSQPIARTVVDDRQVYAWPFTGAGTGEASIAVDPTNSSRMSYHALGLSDYVPYYSMDGGLAWTKSTAFTVGGNTVLLDPWISYDADGVIYAGTYIGNSTHPYDWQYPFLAKSSDHGRDFALMPTSYSPPWTTWQMPDSTSKPSCNMPGPGAIDFPKVVADTGIGSPFKNYVYVFGAAGVNSTGGSLCIGQTSFIRSTDGGLTFDIHHVLNGLDNQAIVRPNNIAIASNGTIYFTSTYTGGGVLLVYSKDGGLSWATSPINLGFGADQTYVAVSPSDPNNLHIVFERALSDSSLHIYMIASQNGGASWSTPVRLDDQLSNDKVDHTLPVVTVAGDGTVYAAWRDFRNTPTRTPGNSNFTDIYAYSSRSPSSNLRVSNATGRYCGAYSPCYRVTGNDYFTIASGPMSGIVGYSIDQQSTSWPQAYAAILSTSSSGSGQPGLVSQIATTLVTNLFLIIAVIITAILTVVLALHRRNARSVSGGLAVQAAISGTRSGWPSRMLLSAS